MLEKLPCLCYNSCFFNYIFLLHICSWLKTIVWPPINSQYEAILMNTIAGSLCFDVGNIIGKCVIFVVFWHWIPQTQLFSSVKPFSLIKSAELLRASLLGQSWQLLLSPLFVFLFETTVVAVNFLSAWGAFKGKLQVTAQKKTFNVYVYQTVTKKYPTSHLCNRLLKLIMAKQAHYKLLQIKVTFSRPVHVEIMWNWVTMQSATCSYLPSRLSTYSLFFFRLSWAECLLRIFLRIFFKTLSSDLSGRWNTWEDRDKKEWGRKG